MEIDNVKIYIKTTNIKKFQIYFSTSEMDALNVPYSVWLQTHELGDVINALDNCTTIEDIETEWIRNKCIAVRKYTILSSVAKKVTDIVNASFDGSEIDVWCNGGDYFDENIVKRYISYFCDDNRNKTNKSLNDLEELEEWALIRYVTQNVFIQDWLTNSTHIPYNKVLHEKWNDLYLEELNSSN